MKQKFKKKKKMFWVSLGLFSRWVVFLEILKLKNPYEIANSLSNALHFKKRCKTITYQSQCPFRLLLTLLKVMTSSESPKTQFYRSGDAICPMTSL